MPGLAHNRVLLIGFPPTIPLSPAFRELFGSAETVRAQLDAGDDRIRRAGITPVTFYIEPLEQEKELKRLEGLLQEGGYDAVGIGGGVRLNPEYSELFETLVNMCGRILPGVPFLFTDKPGQAPETIERVLGVRIP